MKKYSPKKEHYKEPSAAEILSRKHLEEVGRTDMAAALLSNPGCDRAFIYVDGRRLINPFYSDRKFRKHAPELRLYSSKLTLEAARLLTQEYTKKEESETDPYP